MHISVFLGSDFESHRFFRCIFCGKKVAEVTGEVYSVTSGNVGDGMEARYVKVRCLNKNRFGNKCNTDYVFYD